MEKSMLYDAHGNQLDIQEAINLLPLYLINRVEVIDEKGRSYVNWKPKNQIEIQVQDQFKTLKIFISN